MPEETLSFMSSRFRGFLPVIVDVETGGFNPQTDALLEVAAVTTVMDKHGQLRRADTYSCHVKPHPGTKIEASALAFTGIDPHSPLRGAVTEKEALQRIFHSIRQELKSQNCTRAILVGHNAAFDHAFLKVASERQQVKRNPFHPFSCFDTATLAGLAFGHTVLAKACQLAKIEFDTNEAHSAGYDAEKTADLFCKIVNKWHHLGGWPLGN